MAAFRCKNCGHIHPAEHAGENLVPHACVVCGSGITHSPTVEAAAKELADPKCTPERRQQLAADLLKAAKTQDQKTWQQDNWEVLADATPSRLKELGLEKAHVKAHKPEILSTPNFPASPVAVHAVEGLKVKDKP